MVGLRPILLNSGSLVRDGDRETLTFSRYKVGLPGCKSAGVCVCGGVFEHTVSDFSTSPHTELPRQTEGEAQNPFSSAEAPPATPQGPGTGAVRGGRRKPLLQAGRKKAEELGERMVDLRKLRGKLGKLWSWQGARSWEGGGVRGICLFLAGCLGEGVHGTSQPSCRNRERPSGGHRVPAGTH